MLKLKSFFILAVFFFLIVPPLQGTIIVDFKEDVPNRIVRAISINTHSKMLDSYEERSISAPTSFSFVGYTLTYGVGHGLTVSNSSQSATDSLMIRFSKQVPSNLPGSVYDFESTHYFWSSVPIVEKTPEDIKNFFPQPRDKEPIGDSFPITRVNDKAQATLAGLSAREKGNLGELVTKLMMLSFGYTPYTTKYGGDNGFDGVFQSYSQGHLFLTSSKQEKKERTSKNIMKHELNEQKIRDTLGYMERIGDKNVIQTASLINEYRVHNPGNLYKLTQRIMNKGFIQTSFEPFKGRSEELENIVISHIEEGMTEEEAHMAVTKAFSSQKQKVMGTKGKQEEREPPILTQPRKLILVKAIGVSDNTASTSLPKTEEGKIYSRENLYLFLKSLTNYKLKEISSKLEGTEDRSESTLRRLMGDINYAPRKNYTHLWDALTTAFEKEFKEWSPEE